MASAISLLDFVAKTGHGIKGLVDSGISEVPEMYVQPPDEPFVKAHDQPSSEEDRCLSVPIDLSKLGGPENDEVERAIVKASETLGFFQVINHGLDPAFLESMKAAAWRFFEKPAEEKLVYLKGASSNPLVKYSTSFAPEKEKVLQWRDYLAMYHTNDEAAITHWPNECKEEALKYFKVTYEVVKILLKILIKHLEVKVDDARMESLVGLKSVNLNFYPPCPNPELTVGVASHSDLGILTVLLQDIVGGLYVKSGKKWVDIPPTPGALVINIGDSLQILSNGRYISAEHKVLTTIKESRVSIPLFVLPSASERIGPLPELVGRDGGTQYKEVLYQDYMDNYMGSAHEGKKALAFAKIN